MALPKPETQNFSIPDPSLDTNDINKIVNLTQDETGKKCGQCSKTFSSLGLLKMHSEIIHEGIKNFRCDECQKVYSSPQVLKKHFLCVHEGIRNYQCSYCEKTFGQSGDMKRHIDSTHLGIQNVWKRKK